MEGDFDLILVLLVISHHDSGSLYMEVQTTLRDLRNDYL